MDDHVVFNVSSIEIHERYNSQNYDKDFSMLKLSTEVDFVKYPNIRPICLPSSTNNTYAGLTATVTGWGTTSYNKIGNKSVPVKSAESFWKRECQ